MEGLRIFGARLRGLFRKRHLDRELEAELQAHLESLTEENIRRGMNSKEAAHSARREFGGIEQAKELYREQRSLPFLETLFQDVRYALRIDGGGHAGVLHPRAPCHARRSAYRPAL
jgi:hypothetical protein